MDALVAHGGGHVVDLALVLAVVIPLGVVWWRSRGGDEDERVDEEAGADTRAP